MDKKNEYLRIILAVVENNFSRTKHIKDPVTRHLLFLDKLTLTVDSITAGVKLASIDSSLDPDIKERIDNVVETLNTNILDLIDWIQQPVYSPDHPVGNQMMEAAKKDFENSTE